MFCGAATAIAAVTWFSLPHEAKQAPRAMIAPPRDVSLPRRPTIGELRKAEPSRELALVRPDADSITRRELAMVAQLHVLKADLGEPIELERAGDRLTLTASDFGADRTREITEALAQFPDVTLRFVGPKADASKGLNGPATSTARRPIAFEAELVQYAGGRQSLQKLIESLLDASDQVTVYAHALANLHKRFPPSVLSSLSAGDRTLLDRIKADHTSGARQAAHALLKLIDPIFKSLAIEALPESRGNLIEAALKVDRLLNAAFSGAQSDLSDRDLYAELRGWLARLVELIG